MKTKLSKIMAVMLGFIMCFALFAVAGCAEADDEEKIYFDFSQISLETDMSDNEFYVTFKNKESLKFKDYTPEDFPGIDCIDIRMEKTFYSETGYYKDDEAVKAAIESGELDKSLYHRQCLLTLAKHDKQGVINGMKELEKRGDILKVEPDYYGNICETYSNDDLSGHQWAIERLKLDKAWDITTGSNEIKVGVIDTGIDGTHPDLTNRVDRTLSKSFPEGSNLDPLQDVVGHGTHVAGIIGAEGNNGIYVSGVCWDVSLVSLRVSETGLGINSDAVADAIKYAMENNIQILNYSVGHKALAERLDEAIKITTVYLYVGRVTMDII